MNLAPDLDLARRLSTQDALWLFLDYDGTLADFAPTPDIVVPDEGLIRLVTALAAVERNRVTILSGRRLAHIQKLLPVPGILKAGSYGLEIQLPDGRLVHRVEYGSIRPALEDVKAKWEALLAGKIDFFLEDKGWTLAIHAKDAGDKEAEEVLAEARRSATPTVVRSEQRLRFQGGHRFLEIAPVLADKRQSVEYLMEQYPKPRAMALYFGDDDKDEVAFEAVQVAGGLAFAVGDRLVGGPADHFLTSPRDVREWLSDLVEAQKARGDQLY